MFKVFIPCSKDGADMQTLNVHLELACHSDITI
jgi:hypothetical protein